MKTHIKLLKKINKAKIISFDVFDTLILRNVLEPADIFSVVQKEYEKNGDLLNFDFKTERIKAEINLRNKLATEITLDGIYDELLSQLSISNKLLEELKTLEIKTELNFCVQNPYMYEIYKYVLKNKKKIILNSDMYLPVEVIEKILNKNGYTEYEKIYLSSQTLKTKQTGESYDLIINDFKIKPSKILHIGDNQGADVLKAQEKGLNSFYYARCIDYLKYKNFEESELYKNQSIENSIFKALCLNKTNCYREEKDFWYDLGYKSMGPVLYNFINGIINFVNENEIKKIFFVSRDGYIMKKVYDIFASCNKNLPESQYFYASRKLFHFPILADCNDLYENPFFMNYINKLKITTIKDFFEYFNINLVNYKKTIDFLSSTPLSQPNNKNNLKNILKIVHNEIIKNAKQEKENILKYFEQEDFLKSQKIAWIDIGWQGNVQLSLLKILENTQNTPEIYGYYFGLMEIAKNLKKNLNIKGHFFDCEKTEFYRPISTSLSVIEFLFGAPHGSVIGLMKENNKFKPFFDKDFSKNKIKKIISVQEGCINFIKDFLNIKNNYNWTEIEKEAGISALLRLLDKPSLEEAINIGNISFINGHEKEFSYIAKPLSFWERLITPKSIHKKINNYVWLAGYQRRLDKNKKQNLNYNSNVFDEIIKSKEFKKRLEFLKNKYKNKKIVFYGAGLLAEHFVNNTDLSGFDIAGFVDNNINKKGEKCGSYDIFHLSDLKNLKPELIVVTMLNTSGIDLYLKSILDKNLLSAEILTDLLN